MLRPRRVVLSIREGQRGEQQLTLPECTKRLVMHFCLGEGKVLPLGAAVSEIVLVFRDEDIELEVLVDYLVALSRRFAQATVRCIADQGQAERVQRALDRHFGQHPAPHALPEVRTPEEHGDDIGLASFALEMQMDE
jgi:hypothetical protein